MKENITTGIKKDRANKAKRPLGITVVALRMILFGFAGVVAGFTHHFFGIYTSGTAVFSYSGAAIFAVHIVWKWNSFQGMTG